MVWCKEVLLFPKKKTGNRSGNFSWADLEGADGAAATPFWIFYMMVTNHLSSSDTVQSAQGCSCVVGMEQCCALAKNFPAPSF